MRAKEPTISQVEIAGKIRHRVTYWTGTGRKREHFTLLTDAKNRVAEIQREAKQYGTAAEAMTSEARADAIAALRLLRGTGATLQEAARFYADERSRREDGKPIAEVVEAFLRSRESRSNGYIRALRPRLELFASHFTGKTTTGIGPDAIQDFLDAISATSAPKSVAHHRTAIQMLFRFAQARQWCSSNPAIATAPIRLPDATPEILTPQEADSIVRCSPDELRAGIVLQLFVGLRRAEAMRIDWRDIDIEHRTVTIAGKVAKTGSRRVATIPENAVAWLRPLAKTSGPVLSDSQRTRDAWDLTRAQAGFGHFFSDNPRVLSAFKDAGDTLKPWPNNAMRHSAISYFVAMNPDLGRAAYYFGNSSGVIQRSYNGLATPTQAKAFYAIRPEAPDNVVRIKRHA